MPAALSYPMNMKTLRLGVYLGTGAAPGGEAAGLPTGQRSLAGPHRSTGWSTCGGTQRTLTTGQKVARMGGLMLMCCPITSGWRPGTMAAMAATLRGAARTGHCMSHGAHARTRCFKAFVEAGQASGIRSHGRLQRRKARGLWPDGANRVQRAALVCGKRLFATGAQTRELQPDQRLVERGCLYGRAGHGRCYGGWNGGARRARSYSGRVLDQLAQNPDAVGDRAGRASGGTRH